MNGICCIEGARTTLKLQVRETFSCTIVRESSAEYCFVAQEDIQVGQGFLKHAIPWFVALQTKIQFSHTLYQWFLHIEAVGGLCILANECSKGGELLSTGQLFNSSPNHDHTSNMSSDKQTLPTIIFRCSPNKRPSKYSGNCLKTGFQTSAPRA